MPRRSSRPPRCRFPPIWKKALATGRRTRRATITLAAGIGLVGGSIEDASGDPAQPLYDHRATRRNVSLRRCRPRAPLAFPFVLTARAEGYLRGNPNLDDTIRRLQAFEAAGADVLMAPGLPDLDAVRAVCAAVSKPVNFMAGIKGRSFTVAELAEAGVKRISLATSLFRAAMTGTADRGDRGARPRDIQLPRHDIADAGLEPVHDGMNQPGTLSRKVANVRHATRPPV